MNLIIRRRLIVAIIITLCFILCFQLYLEWDGLKVLVNRSRSNSRTSNHSPTQPPPTTTATVTSKPPNRNSGGSENKVATHNSPTTSDNWNSRSDVAEVWPIIQNKRRAMNYNWWQSMDLYHSHFPEEVQINRTSYLDAFDHVIRTLMEHDDSNTSTQSLKTTTTNAHSLTDNNNDDNNNSNYDQKQPSTNTNTTESGASSKKAELPYAYVTFVDSSPHHRGLNYMYGVLALIGSWKLSKSKIPFIVMHTGVLPKKISEPLKNIPGVSIVSVNKDSIPMPQFAAWTTPEWRISFQKLSMFSMVQYEKIVFLDSDTMLLQNVDEMFGLPNLSAGRDNCDHCKIHRGMNAGVLVIEPSLDTWNFIKDYSQKKSCLTGNFRWSDQELLICLYAKDVPERIGTWHALPLEYNFFLNNCDCRPMQSKDPLYSPWNDDELKILHYTCSGKPWGHMSRRDYFKHPLASWSCQDRYIAKWFNFLDYVLTLMNTNLAELQQLDS